MMIAKMLGEIFQALLNTPGILFTARFLYGGFSEIFWGDCVIVNDIDN